MMKFNKVVQNIVNVIEGLPHLIDIWPCYLLPFDMASIGIYRGTQQTVQKEEY